jgi:tRNA-2-methylthio-N6-dimethylallyladenosine synthase
MMSKTVKSKTVYIHTIGCQMNVYDSRHMAQLLVSLGYEQTPLLETADLIIMNTCTIREKAEQKVFSFLGRLATLKKKRPELLLGVGGCVAQQEGKHMLRRMPHLNFVFGTRAIPRLPNIIKHVLKEKCQVVDIDLTKEMSEPGTPKKIRSDGSPTRFVTIMRGCNNYCAYCVVPHVRGKETSRPSAEILDDIHALVDSGVKEVTLLGQNVNSYGKKEGRCSFSELLTEINKIHGLLRIRFITSHPKDFSDDIIHTFKNLDKLCPHLHLPVQSGSNRILKRMNRNYTRELYLEKIEKLRALCPQVAITSDFIVGFPGETEADFNESVKLIKSVEYDSLFVFKYSDRPNAPATHFSNKISELKKQNRLKQILHLQAQITEAKNTMLLGSTQLVLVDGHSKMNPTLNTIQWTGRTPTNKVVNFANDTSGRSGESSLIGRLIRVKIEKTLSHSLRGKQIGMGVTKPVTMI